MAATGPPTVELKACSALLREWPQEGRPVRRRPDVTTGSQPPRGINAERAQPDQTNSAKRVNRRNGGARHHCVSGAGCRDTAVTGGVHCGVRHRAPVVLPALAAVALRAAIRRDTTSGRPQQPTSSRRLRRAPGVHSSGAPASMSKGRLFRTPLPRAPCMRTTPPAYARRTRSAGVQRPWEPWALGDQRRPAHQLVMTSRPCGTAMSRRPGKRASTSSRRSRFRRRVPSFRW